jgi:hypothetical protein
MQTQPAYKFQQCHQQRTHWWAQSYHRSAKNEYCFIHQANTSRVGSEIVMCVQNAEL